MLTDDNRLETTQDESDKEQRRATRLGAIIAIVAIVGTLCTLSFKLTVSSINIWAEQGIIYWYLQVLFLLALSTFVIIFVDIIVYILCDLKRYDIKDGTYKQYDQKSDDKYRYMLNDFRIYTIMFIGVFLLILPLSAIYGEEKYQQWGGIIYSCICLIFGIVVAIRWIKLNDKKKIKNTMQYVGSKFGEWIFVALGCFTIGAIILLDYTAKVEVNFKSNGIVEICNTSTENYKGLDIELYSMNGDMIYSNNVDRERVLFAQEDKYVKNKVNGKVKAEGIVINSEKLHWKYIFDLKKILEKPGEYYISIMIYQDKKEVELLNSFTVEGNKYTFAKDDMQKEY